MSIYIDSIEFVTIKCYKCGVPFGMTSDLNNRCLRDHSRPFYCPNGHRQVYIGKTEAQKLREKLDHRENELQAINHDLNTVSNSYKKMRKRIANGVCPCCNRTFMNLMQHMKTKHPDFSKGGILRTLRTTFGLSQRALADEIGVDANHVSLYEREKSVSAWASQSIDVWINKHEVA